MTVQDLAPARRAALLDAGARLSPAAAGRLRQRIDALLDERAAVVAAGRDVTGDAADQAALTARDLELERIDDQLRRLRDVLDSAVVADAAAGADRVAPGVAVTLRFGDDPQTERYLVGVMSEQDDDVTVVTPSSPLGKALLGAAVGDTVEYQSPRGVRQVTVVGLGG